MGSWDQSGPNWIYVLVVCYSYQQFPTSERKETLKYILRRIAFRCDTSFIEFVKYILFKNNLGKGIDW